LIRAAGGADVYGFARIYVQVLSAEA